MPLVRKLRSADVLNGGAAMSYPGNVYFRSLTKRRQEEYMSTNCRKAKAKIAREILQQVANRRGRFLSRVEPGEGDGTNAIATVDIDDAAVWEILDESAAMEKAKQALRRRENRKILVGGHQPVPTGAAGGAANQAGTEQATMATVHNTATLPLRSYHYSSGDDRFKGKGNVNGLPSVTLPYSLLLQSSDPQVTTTLPRVMPDFGEVLPEQHPLSTAWVQSYNLELALLAARHEREWERMRQSHELQLRLFRTTSSALGMHSHLSNGVLPALVSEREEAILMPLLNHEQQLRGRVASQTTRTNDDDGTTGFGGRP